MNDEKNLQPNDLDSLIGDNHLQMMKAALPYMNVPEQRFISLFVKVGELQRTVRLFEDEEVATMGICSVGEERPRSVSALDMLGAIKPFASPSEQDFIDLITNFYQGFKIAGAASDPVPSSTIHDPAPSETSGWQAEAQNRQTEDSNRRAENLNRQTEGQPRQTEGCSKQTEGPNRQTASQHRSNGGFGRMPFDQLKNFIPPEQQSKLETMQLMMSAMQQMN